MLAVAVSKLPVPPSVLATMLLLIVFPEALPLILASKLIDDHSFSAKFLSNLTVNILVVWLYLLASIAT